MAEARRCSWCGVFVPKATEPWTFLNWYGQPTTQVHCPSCRPSADALAARNLSHLTFEETG